MSVSSKDILRERLSALRANSGKRQRRIKGRASPEVVEVVNRPKKRPGRRLRSSIPTSAADLKLLQSLLQPRIRTFKSKRGIAFPVPLLFPRFASDVAATTPELRTRGAGAANWQ